MKFNCGLTVEERAEQWAREEAEYDRRIAEWHDWFAWYPVRVGPSDCRWLETVECRCVKFKDFSKSIDGDDFTRVWSYRAK